MRRMRQQIASVCGACGSTLLAYAAHAVVTCQRRRRIRQQIASVCAACGSTLLAYTAHAVAKTKQNRNFFKGEFFLYVIQHCFICHPSDSTVSEDAGIEPRPLAMTARRSNHLATTSQISSTWLGLIHWQISSTRLDLIHEARSHPQGQILYTSEKLLSQENDEGKNKMYLES